MDGAIKTLIETGQLWYVLAILPLLIVYKFSSVFIDRILKSRKKNEEKSKIEAIDEQNKLLVDGFAQMTAYLKTVSEALSNKDRVIDRINRKMSIIANQYDNQLSKQSAIQVVQNLYKSFAHEISDELYELQKESYSQNTILNHIKSKVNILNDDRIQELECFSYQNKELITFTPGEIISENKIVDIFNQYSKKNGMLRAEIQNSVMLEAQKVVKRF